MPRLALLAALVSTLLLSACFGGDGAEPGPTSTPSATVLSLATATPSATGPPPTQTTEPLPDWAYPPGTVTGETAVDMAIEAVHAGDEDALLAGLHSVPAPCVEDPAPQVLTPPTCGDVQAAGDPVPAFLYHGCMLAGVVDARFGLADLLDLGFAGGMHLGAVARLQNDFLAGEEAYAVLFSEGPPAPGTRSFALFLDEAGIIGFGRCDYEQYVEEAAAAEFLLPPK